MREIIEALTTELRRLKASGVRTVNISPDTLAALRAAVRGRAFRDPQEVPKSPLDRPAPAVAVRDVLEINEPQRLAPLKQTQATKPLTAEPQGSVLPPPPVVQLPGGDKAMRMAWLCETVLSDPICRARVRPGKKVVVGVGNLDARIFFCGEAPGAEEEIQGEPFVGPAGQLLTRMIQGMGLKRQEVYIGNIMNWRPDLPTPPGHEQIGNRAPTPSELTYCLPYLRAQLEIVDPQIIVALGSTAAQGLFGVDSFKTLGEIRGKWKLFSEKPVMVTYHPSYILRNGSSRSKRAIWEDLLMVMERANLPISEKQRGYFLDR